MFHVVSPQSVKNAGKSDSSDYMHYLHASIVNHKGRLLMYWKGYPASDLLASQNPSKINVTWLSDGYDDGYGGSRLPTVKPVRTYDNDNINPVIDSGVGEFNAPLDVYTNPSLEEGGRMGDMTAISFKGELFLYCSMYNYNNEGSNRLGLFRSSDGINFDKGIEINSPNGENPYFGRSVGGITAHDSTLYMSAANRIYKSTNGIDWEHIGLYTAISENEYDPHTKGLIIGRLYTYKGYMYSFMPASRFKDWPECILVYRRKIEDVDNGGMWDLYPHPVMLRSPDKGAIWQLTPFTINGDVYGINNTVGMHGEYAIGIDDMNLMRENPYHEYNEKGFKHITISKAQSLRVFDDEWSVFPVDDGDSIAIKIGGKYLSYKQNDTVVLTTQLSTTCHWVLEKIGLFWYIKPANNPDKSLTPSGGDNLRRMGVPFIVSPLDRVTHSNNFPMQWWLSFLGDSDSLTAVINRFTSLAVGVNASQQPYYINSGNYCRVVKINN